MYVCKSVYVCVRERESEAERCVKILKKNNIKSFNWLKMVNRPSRSRNQSRKINYIKKTVHLKDIP